MFEKWRSLLGTKSNPVLHWQTVPCNIYNNQQDYHKNVIVYRCINLISRGIASIPWLLYENDHEINEHDLLRLIRFPNLNQGGAGFIEAITSNLLLHGNAFVELIFNQSNKPCAMQLLRAEHIKILSNMQYEVRVNGQSRVLSKQKILHLKTFNPNNDFFGLSPLQAAGLSISQHTAVSEHNIAILQNGGRPSGALMLKSHHLNNQQRQQLRQDVQSIYAGNGNAGRIMVLEGDFEWKEMGLSPKDLDFGEGKNIAAREIAQVFGVPSMLVGVPGDSTFANYKEARLHLWEDTILPLLENMMMEFNTWLSNFYDPNLRFQYDIDSISALAPKREATWRKLQNINFLTINEKRQAIGYSPVEGGDKL